jgi:hypothetical protein
MRPAKSSPPGEQPPFRGGGPSSPRQSAR